MRKTIQTLLWRVLAVFALILGIVGAILPVIPTVPFILVAAWAASKGWPRLEAWLVNHHHFGHSIRQWRDRRAVPRKAKWFATLAMSGSALMLMFLPLPEWATWARIAIPILFILIGTWLWRRPEH